MTVQPSHFSQSPLPIRASGKLLLTGEYFVLDGAHALALPVRFGQTLTVDFGTSNQSPQFHWQSLDADGTCWFSASFDLTDFSPIEFSDEKTARTLQAILQKCRQQNPNFLAPPSAVHRPPSTVSIRADFPRKWGLGTSSTLIAAVAKWAGVDPYKVLFETLGGSGYDIACAFAEAPILYRLDGQQPEIQPVAFEPDFTDQLYFVFLGQKQDSREGIRRYRERAGQLARLIPEISDLTRRFLAVRTLSALDEVIVEHENLVAAALDLSRAKSLYFNDFWGEVKSLGAWGGDFVLVTSPRPEAETRRFFNEKGFDTFFPYREMVALKNPTS